MGRFGIREEGRSEGSGATSEYRSVQRSSAMRRDYALASIVGILVGAAFGRVWLSWAGEGLPAWQAAIEVAGWVVFGGFVVAGALVAFKVFRAPPQEGGELPNPARGAWFAVVVPVEVALISGGQSLLGEMFGHPEWNPVWTLFVVGAHFFPFAWILRVSAFHKLARALCAVAVVSAFAASLVGAVPLWSVLPGFGGAAVLWGFAGWALNRMASGQWPPMDEQNFRA